ncbi:PilN domain-containing protein [Ruegeria pomeroyi]|uniref:PilN domain-containing protein n=1 Tax=Ruegeria pomeroyi TaxID=89184 RepID=UPI001F2D7919|nr:PilN domain-containing protein [Ruegeria pomeroyi]MCE8510912.1 PilN domain-containing protein [Ruegeria pomeroyi]
MKLQERSPIPLDRLASTVVKGVTHSGKTTYLQYAVKRDALDALLERVANAGLRARSVKLKDDDREIDLRRIKLSQDLAQRIWWFSALASTILACVSIAALLNHMRDAAAVNLNILQDKKIELANQALALKESNETHSQKEEEWSRTRSLFALGLNRLSQLDSLTSVVSDDSWISELRVIGDTMDINGFTSSDVNALVQDIDALNWTQETTLNGPVATDRTSGKYRFQIVTGITESESSE